MAKYNKERAETFQCQERATMDVDKYFALYDKLLPTGLMQDDSVLLFKIDNIDVVERIIARNPDAKYVVFGNAAMNESMKMLGFKQVVKYYDAVKKFDDRKRLGEIKTTWTCWGWWQNPEGSDLPDFFAIGLKKGQRVSLLSKDKKLEYAHTFIYDERHVIDDAGHVSTYNNWLHGFMNSPKMKQLLKRDCRWDAHLYTCDSHTGWNTRFGIVNNKSLDLHKLEWLKSRYVVKND